MTRRRALSAVALVLVLVVVAGALTLVYVVRRPSSAIGGEMRLLGLEASAEVLRDVDGVPHIYAQSEHDLYFLQGYVMAQDRLFQLELFRRIGQGRLSEMFGAASLEADRLLRTLGMYRVAEREVILLGPEVRLGLEAYAAGVNKFVENHRSSLPLEFVILGIDWEPWRPADTLVVGKVMAWDLGGNMDTELLRADIVARLSEDALRALFPDAPATLPPIVGATRLTPSSPLESPQAASPLGSSAIGPIADPAAPAIRVPGREQLRAIPGGGGELLGSNNWVLAGSRTTTGKPVLANDTHLGVQNPAIWYLVHLAGAGVDVIGFTLPGVPGVVIGHNDRVAWGLTNVNPDVQDLYVEQPNPQDMTQFRFRDRWETAEVRREEIRVSGRSEPVALDVVVTRHGPVLTPVLEGTKQVLALRWTALEPGRIFQSVYLLNRARNFDEFREALRFWDVPSQNVVYADVDGHIGYQMPGRVPIRARGDGSLPVPGWSGEYEWTGFVQFEALLTRLDPPDGFIVTANQRPSALGPYIGKDFDPGYRAERIRELILSKEKHGIEDVARMQVDAKDLYAEWHLEYLAGSVVARDDASARALETLRRWDATMTTDSVAATIYHAWFKRMAERVFRDKLGDALYRQYLGSGRAVASALLALAATPDSPWYRELARPGVRGRDELAGLALRDAVRDLTRLLGSDQSRWTWGRVHRITFDHPLGSVRPLDLVFNIGPFAHGGSGFTVPQGSFSLRAAGFEQTVYPSQRYVADLADWDSSRGILPTGQSGLPFARHWGDMTRRYLAGELAPLRYRRDGLGTLEGHLILRPR